MTNNDILRRIRYIFDLGDTEMMALFSTETEKMSREQVVSWLKKDEDAGYQLCADAPFTVFLNNFIRCRRGGRQDASLDPDREQLSNNAIFKKLKIALSLPSQDVLAILAQQGLAISKHELSALFRKPGHKHYRKCQDQILRKFLQGLQHKYRPSTATPRVAEPENLTKSESVWVRPS